MSNPKALIHYPSRSDSPVGIWWVDPLTDKVDNFYDDPQGPEATLGRLTVMQKTVASVPWEDWFNTLEQSAPYFVSWETAPLLPTISPDKMLKMLQKQQALPIPA